MTTSPKLSVRGIEPGRLTRTAGFSAAAIVASGVIPTLLLLEPTAAGIAAVNDNLAHVGTMITRLPRNFTSIFPPLLIVTSSWWPGRAIARLMRLPSGGVAMNMALALVCGLGLWTLAGLMLGACSALYAPVVYWAAAVGTAAGAVAGGLMLVRLRSRDMRLMPHADAVCIGLLMFIGLALWIALLAALEPEVGFDARRYHLGDALRFAQHHRIYDLVAAEHMIYGGFSNYQEVMYAINWLMGGMEAAKAYAWMLGAVAVFVLVAVVHAVWGSWRAALTAGAIFSGTPIVAWSMTTASTDLPAVPFALVALYAIYRWAGDAKLRWMVLAGGTIGITLGIKAFGVELAACLIATITVIALRRADEAGFRSPARATASLALFGSTAVITAAGWFIESALTTRDPIYPLALQLFHTPFSVPSVYAELAGTYREWGADEAFWTVLLSPVRLTFDVGQYRSILGAAYLAGAPLVCLAVYLGRYRDAAFVTALLISLCAVVLLYAGRTVDVRYLQWDLAVAAGLIAVSLDDILSRPDAPLILRVTAVAVVGIAVIAANQLLLPVQRGAFLPQVNGRMYLNWAYIYDGQSDESIQIAYVPMIEYMNAHLPRNARVFDRADLLLFNAYSDVELFEGKGFDSPSETAGWRIESRDAFARLKASAITHVVVYESEAKHILHAPIGRHLHLVHHQPHGPSYLSDDFGTDLYELR